MEQNKTLTLDEQFNKDCEIVNLRYEYPGYTGTESYGIITKLSESELNVKYSAFLEPYIPFVVLPAEMSQVRRIYERNEEKFKKRARRNDSLFSIEQEAEKFHSEMSTPSVEELFMGKEGENEMHKKLRKVLFELPDTQKRRILLHYFQNKTLEEIGKAEGCSAVAVWHSISVAIKNIKKQF